MITLRKGVPLVSNIGRMSLCGVLRVVDGSQHSARSKAATDQSIRMLGCDVEQADTNREDLVENRIAEIERFERLNREPGDSRFDAASIALGRGTDHLRRPGDTKPNLEHSITGLNDQLTDDSLQAERYGLPLLSVI
jgi:hypothetical protein